MDETSSTPARLAGAAAAMLRDFVGLVGATSICYGVWLIFPPAAYVVGGVMLLAAALLLTRRDGSAP